ncbi:uncharacterized protein [Amphiura filiformis]|uniref:uncharacterized protein n=1 Tax=Amphiura filiformis TaxID=82378 RepID=UPI003B21DF87
MAGHASYKRNCYSSESEEYSDEEIYVPVNKRVRSTPNVPNESTLLEDISQQLTCSICLHQYTNPKIVTPCCHTFCNDCLEETIATNASSNDGGKEYTFNCPQCRGTVTFDDPFPCYQLSVKRIAQEVVIKLYKPNFEVQGLIDIINKKTESSCSKHTGESLTFFCKTCEQCICQLCHIDKHMIQKHDVTSVKHEAHAIRTAFDKDMIPIENRMKDFKSSLQDSLKDASRMTSDADELINILDTARTKICQFKKNIRQQESKCKESIAKADSYQKDCAMLKQITEGKDVQLLQKRKEAHRLRTKLKYNTTNTPQLPRNQLPEVYQDASRALNEFGTNHNWGQSHRTPSRMSTLTRPRKWTRAGITASAVEECFQLTGLSDYFDID